MSDDASRERFWDRYYNRQVCSPAENHCRNNALLDEIGAALSASEARVKELEEALERIAAYPDQEVEKESITVAMMARAARAALKGKGNEDGD